ncbi:MAG: signal peptidase II [Planctomycetaceae bacterium]
MSPRMRCLIVGVTLVLLVGCDQASKGYATDHWQHTERNPMLVVGQSFFIQYAVNRGAFLSLFANLPEQVRLLLLVVMNGIVLSGVAFVLLFRSGWNKWTFVALALLLAGGVGNLIDRLSLGGVIDFMVIDFSALTGIGWLRTGVFNVADVAITTGFLMLLPQLMRKDPKRPPAAEATTA